MLPTFPSRYWSTIGLLGVFSLAGWSPRFLTGFLVSPPYSGCLVRASPLPVQGCHLLRPAFPDRSGSFFALLPRPLLPRTCLDTPGLGSSPFARHYSGNRCFFLLLQVLRCFSSLRSLRPLAGDRPPACRVAPFGHPRIITRLRFPGVFSQLAASFLASRSLGILRPPLLPSFVFSF